MTGIEVAERLFGALMKGDLRAVSDLYAANVVVWHNYDAAEQTKEENLKMLGWLIGNTSGLRYDEVRRSATTDGFVQQHVLRLEWRGHAFHVPACIVATVSEGRISRIDEYLDSVPIAALLGR